MRSSRPLRLPDGSVPEMYFVDLDGTLLSTSSEKLFLKRLLRRGILKGPDFVRFLAGYLLHPITTFREGKGWNRAYLRGVAPAVAKKEAAGCSEDLLEGYVREWTGMSMEELKGQGCEPVILSASLEYIATGVASGLGVRRVCASRPETADGCFTGKLRGTRPWGRNKALLADDICREAGVEPGRCAAAGDSWADRFVLEMCGCRVAVCPDRKLRRLAERRGWRVEEGKHTRWA